MSLVAQSINIVQGNNQVHLWLTLSDSTLENRQFQHWLYSNFQLTNALVMYMTCFLALIVKPTKVNTFALTFAILANETSTKSRQFTCCKKKKKKSRTDANKDLRKTLLKQHYATKLLRWWVSHMNHKCWSSVFLSFGINAKSQSSLRTSDQFQCATGGTLIRMWKSSTKLKPWKNEKTKDKSSITGVLVFHFSDGTNSQRNRRKRSAHALHNSDSHTSSSLSFFLFLFLVSRKSRSSFRRPARPQSGKWTG